MDLRAALSSLAPRLPPTAWLAAFDDLTPSRLHALMALRQRVFVLEQRCLYLDADHKDPLAFHLGFGAPPDLTACARLFLPGALGPWGSIGRVVTAPTHRGQGLGRLVVQTSVEVLDALAPDAEIHIEAQQYLERFYGAFGFVTVGAPYLEDDIPHVPMVRRASRP